MSPPNEKLTLLNKLREQISSLEASLKETENSLRDWEGRVARKEEGPSRDAARERVSRKLEERNRLRRELDTVLAKEYRNRVR